MRIANCLYAEQTALHIHERFTQKGGERTRDKQKNPCARISRIRSRDGQNFNDRN